MQAAASSGLSTRASSESPSLTAKYVWPCSSTSTPRRVSSFIILVMPRLLNSIVAIYLIMIGLIGPFLAAARCGWANPGAPGPHHSHRRHPGVNGGQWRGTGPACPAAPAPRPWAWSTGACRRCATRPSGGPWQSAAGPATGWPGSNDRPPARFRG
ncbi:MAG: DUF3096 domain-containing protein [Rubrivivax sp.]|nr:DUF3096 domain-containing protein [Rubrivivax sp.]